VLKPVVFFPFGFGHGIPCRRGDWDTSVYAHWAARPRSTQDEPGEERPTRARRPLPSHSRVHCLI
jgi:hypothetical protein